MKAYTNKIDRIDSSKCLFSEIKKGYKAAKKAVRRNAKKEIKGILEIELIK